jgi:hypothetical protein
MSHFLERLTYLSRRREPFAEGLGELRDEDRTWEEGYRQRWQHDKIVRSTAWRELHGWMQLEDLRQERRRYLGNAADRLSAYAPGHAEP